MKGRSHHRLPISDPPDDWGDGPWTVDCACGVNYDDGEEMVNCDECGVWVHTRCSRFVKGETSFACDKCKKKKGRCNDNSEETEVAQLLVELPNKTVCVRPPAVPVPSRRPFRLWTDIPMEERVHVQGVPGGDPALFQNLSSVFTSELWKCTGYVPKKFNFQYREFPCWEEEEKRHESSVAGPEEENENPVDRGADVLFSLSKEIIPYAPPAETISGLRSLVDGAECERKSSPKEKRQEGAKGGSCGGRMQNWAKRERNQLRPVGVHFGKRKKEESGGPKERSGKKKVRSSDKEADDRKRGSMPAGDAHTLEFQEGALKVADFPDLKNEGRKETILAEPNSDSQLEASNNNDVIKPISSAKAPAEDFSNEVCGNGFPPETLIKLENIEQQDSASVRISPTVDAFAVSPTEGNDVAKASIKQEDGNTAAHGLNGVKDESQNMGDLSGGSSSVAVDSEMKPPVGHLRSTPQGVQSPRMLQDSYGAISLVSFLTKGEVEDSQATGSSELVPFVCDGKLDLVKHSPQRLRTSPVNLSESLQVHDSAVSSSVSVEHKSEGGERESEAVACHNNDTTAEGMVSIPVEPHRCRQELEDLAGPLTVQEGSLKSRHVARYVEETSKSGGTNPSLPAPSLRRLVVGVGKSSSASSTGVVSKSSVSSTNKSVATPSPPSVKSIHFSKQRVKVKSSTDRKKDNAASDAVRDESKQEVPRASVKDRVKSLASGPKTSQTNRISHATSTSKHSASDAKEQVLCPSAKASLTQSAANSSGSAEHSVSSQAQGASQSKHTTPGSKSEKISPSSSHPSSKVINHTPSMPPPAPVNASATLSDEELALLLHQELNSSPRVPRVPRMRHAGSVPQLASPTATSMLAKRPSSSGGKDHISVSRRKTKEEACKDNSRNSRDQADESKKMNRLPPSPDNKRQDSAFTTDGLTKKDAHNRSPDAVASAKKTMLVPSTPVAKPPPSVEANDQNLSSIRSSPRDMSDDDVSGVARTLPGLIAEIMSKGKRMTYDELCNAVLPHWNNLRKHNGERYAYSTHSQAVVDCLRNRNEWAQLIDRGPKTNSSRKRRKLDADLPIESETEDAKDTVTKPIEDKNVKSQQDDFPKGKRKSRKRRRLTLQGRGLKEVRRRQKAEAAADDDFGVYSHSSEGTEGIFSEDESQGGRMAAFASDASTSSSDENGMV